MSKKKILLIFPKSRNITMTESRFTRHLTGKANLLNAALATIAALTPPSFDVEIIDDNLDTIDYDQKVDIVGLTGFFSQLIRAAEIGEEFRKRGVLVVSGGPSASVSAERWRPFSDVMFLGEAEFTWPQFIQDYLAGNHKATYECGDKPDIRLSPIPDYSGYRPSTLKSYAAAIVQTSRGCPFECEFCDVPRYVGRKMRYKDPYQIIKEVEQLHRLGYRNIVLADDNFSAGRKKAAEILRVLRDWNQAQASPVAFSTQMSIDAAKDEEILELCPEAGLTSVLIGIESPNVASLKEAHKTQNVRSNMLADLRKFHEHGITIMGSGIVGFDHDDLNTFNLFLDFHAKAGLMTPNLFQLQAPDATPLKDRIVAEGRYIDYDMDRDISRVNNYNSPSVVPVNMTNDQLWKGVAWTMWRLYDPTAVVERLRTFFSHWEASPKKNKIRFLKPSLQSAMSLHALKIAARVVRYATLQAPPEERRAFFQMLADARKSSYPMALALAFEAFIVMRNARSALLELDPNVPSFPAPHTLTPPTKTAVQRAEEMRKAKADRHRLPVVSG